MQIHDCMADIVEICEFDVSKLASNRYFGVELEYEFNTHRDDYLGLWCTVGRILSIFPERTTIAKEDESLAEGKSIELNFVPFLLDEIEQMEPYFIQFFHDFHGVLRSRAHTGMHVHVNKKNLSEDEIAKFCYFINTNKHYCMGVSNRTYTYWCEYESDKSWFETLQKPSSLATLVTENTLEVRIFKSPLSFFRLMANIKFIDTVIDFCKESTIASIVSVNSFEHYMKYLRHVNTSRNFCDFIEKASRKYLI